jgi:hypothetical protein
LVKRYETSIGGNTDTCAFGSHRRFAYNHPMAWIQINEKDVLPDTQWNAAAPASGSRL